MGTATLTYSDALAVGALGAPDGANDGHQANFLFKCSYLRKVKQRSYVCQNDHQLKLCGYKYPFQPLKKSLHTFSGDEVEAF